MEIQILPLIIVVAYLVGMLTVGAVVSKVQIKNAKDYMVAGRRMGLFMVAFSLSANNIGGGCTTGLAQKAFGDWGLSAVWYVLAASIAMIPLAYFAPKIRKTMAVTIPEVVGRRFGKFSSNFTAILSVLSLFCLTSSQIAASGGVINALIRGVVTEMGATAVTITHDMRTLSDVADRVAMLHEGRFCWQGSASEALSTDDPVMRQFTQGRTEGPIPTLR